MNEMQGLPVVGISTGHEGYPAVPPYSPAVEYPEYPFPLEVASAGGNLAYGGVRNAFYLLRLNADGYGGKEWNPLGGLIRPGDTAVLKPNFVRDFRETRQGHVDCLVTHGSIIRAVLDYVYIALAGRGRIIIADAPQNDADFQAIRRIAGLDEIREFYRRQAGFSVEVYDLRPEAAEKIDGVIVGHTPLPGDPAGYVRVRLGSCSAFAEISHLCHLLYGSEYDTSEVRLHHRDNVHEYVISKTILDADCVINIPKLKTHKKTGITVCLKNLVGINGNKNWLPHYREGTPARDGDQFADDALKHVVERRVVSQFKRLFPLLGPLRPSIARPIRAVGRRLFGETDTETIRSGNWYGNDTTWRMVIDLNRIIVYADARGRLQDRPARRLLNVVDGIIGGEGNGPLDPTPKQAGVVVAGTNAVAVDRVCAPLMGFDYRHVPMVYRAFEDHPLPLVLFQAEDVAIRSNDPRFHGRVDQCDRSGLAFQPHWGWKGHIEIEKECGARDAGIVEP